MGEIDELARKLIEMGWCGLVIASHAHGASRIRGYGRLSEGDARPPHARTVFEIGSVTKCFTATLLADLAARRRVGLDDPLEDHLLNTPIPTRGTKKITLRHVATHFSGLPRMASHPQPTHPDDPYADYTESHLRRFLEACTREHDPGERFEYSNLGYDLLGNALTRREGRSYEDLLLERICGPLRLDDTRIGLTRSMAARLAPGHKPDGDRASNWHIPALPGLGALCSTSSDPRVPVREPAARPSRALLGPAPRPGGATGTGMPDSSLYAGDICLGWRRRPSDSMRWHSGGTAGYASFVGLDRETGTALAVLANAFSWAVARLGLAVMNLMRGRPSDFQLPVEIALDAERLDDFVGNYRFETRDVLTVGGAAVSICEEGVARSARRLSSRES